ncbi:MAG: tetratricopeptide repeat protein [Candidatus Krumholzibacteria bacterium]
MASHSRKKKRAAKAQTPALETFNGFDASPVLDRSDLRNLAIVVALALAVRLCFFLLSRANNPLFFNPIMDGLYHHEWATDILGGNFWGSEVFFRAPLYPYFLALLYKISGSSIAFALICQQLIGTGITVMVYLLSRRFFKRGISLISAVTTALYWPFLYFEGDLLIVTFIMFLNMLALLLLARSLHRPGVALLISAGVVLGLSAVARPSILAFFAVIPLVFYFDALRSGGVSGSPRRWIRHSLLVYIGAAAMIAPVLVRNYVVGRDFVPIASQGGVNFYIGNNPNSDGATAIVPGTRWDWWGGYEDAVRMAEEARGTKLKPSQVSNHYFRKGLSFIFSSPDRSLPLLAKKFYLFWAGGERSNNKSIYFFWHQSGMGKVPLPGFWLIAPFGIAGGVLLWRRRSELWLLYLFAASYMLGVVAFFVNARFRLPVVPILIIFGAYAASYLWDVVRKRRATGLKFVLLLLVCFIAIDSEFARFRENKVHALSIPHYTLGNAYLKTGDTVSAIREYEAALNAYNTYRLPGFELIGRNVIYNLGRLYWAQGDCARAIGYLQRVGGNDRYTVLANVCLAECYVKVSRFLDAIRLYEAILEQAPQTPEAQPGLSAALVGQASVYRRNGDKQRALEYYNRARSANPDNLSIDREIESLQRDG